MSKVDAMRAIKQARLEQLRKEAAGAASTAAPRAVPRTSAARTPTPAVTVAADSCGHRNMSGRSCTRPPGHGEKSHRYG